MNEIKIASWNINSVRLRIGQIGEFVAEENPDVLCLQEIKCLDHQIPREDLIGFGYPHIEVSGQKGMHGAATISKYPLTRMQTTFCPRDEARHVSTHVHTGKGQDFELHNFYIPAGGDEPDAEVNPKFAHKLEFLDNMTRYFKSRAPENAPMVLVGDFNIAPHENDVWSHKQLLKVVSHTPIEVERLARLQAAHDFTDCARAIAGDDEKHSLFSWWSYRSRDINKSDRGRRLDHIWVSPALRQAAIKQGAHKIHRPCRLWERPSDHAPVTQTLRLSA
ncbi:MAG TPA: exodeoxyribonuclease III [Hellea balneolensis]|uniref:Exodeoxyribonuclease III n=1 Tax=Hellea balneolensis TaxID=287478 RepID=A0A7C5LU83_9PROT|nr:exodeoxyribonuclease III [Hellea balneolensis]